MSLKRKKTSHPDPEPDNSLQEARSLQLSTHKKQKKLTAIHRRAIKWAIMIAIIPVVSSFIIGKSCKPGLESILTSPSFILKWDRKIF